MPLSAQGVEGVKGVLDTFVKDNTPGLVFTATDKSGNILVEHASGNVGVESKEALDTETVFWVASCTKLVTAVAVLQLVEQGKASLDDADLIKKVLPEIEQKQVYLDGVNGVPQEKDVTLRMLLAHTAGFGYTFFDPRVPKPDGNDIEGRTGNKNDILNSRLVNQPGSKWEYGVSPRLHCEQYCIPIIVSNIDVQVNIDWAGILLERITGQDLGAYFADHIFNPLSIPASGISMFPTAEAQQNLAHMHQRSPDGVLKEREHLFPGPLSANTPEAQKNFLNSGGAGLFAKPKEYIKILAAILNDGVSPATGQRILKKESVDALWENQIPDQYVIHASQAPRHPHSHSLFSIFRCWSEIASVSC